MAWAAAISPLCLSPSSSSNSFCFHSPSRNPSCPAISSLGSSLFNRLKSTQTKTYPVVKKKFTCRAAEYKFPDPIPEFAEEETEKFRDNLLKKLTKKKDLFEDSIDEVAGVCTEIFSTFLHTEYGGPGTLMVEPFIDMADTLNERGLPGGPQAARFAVKWAQENVDKDWNEWTGADN